MAKNSTCKRLISSVEAADELRVSKTYVNNLVREGRLPCLVVGGKNLFFPEFLDVDHNAKIELHHIEEYANITTKRMFNEDIWMFLNISETTLNKLYRQQEIAFISLSPRVKYVKVECFIEFLKTSFSKCSYYKLSEEDG